MKDQLVSFSCEIELQPGEELNLPKGLAASIGPGRWRVTIEPATSQPVRSHTAFLNSYVAEDEGLYDAYPAR